MLVATQYEDFDKLNLDLTRYTNIKNGDYINVMLNMDSESYTLDSSRLFISRNVMNNYKGMPCQTFLMDETKIDNVKQSVLNEIALDLIPVDVRTLFVYENCVTDKERKEILNKDEELVGTLQGILDDSAEVEELEVLQEDENDNSSFEDSIVENDYIDENNEVTLQSNDLDVSMIDFSQENIVEDEIEDFDIEDDFDIFDTPTTASVVVPEDEDEDNDIDLGDNNDTNESTYDFVETKQDEQQKNVDDLADFEEIDQADNHNSDDILDNFIKTKTSIEDNSDLDVFKTGMSKPIVVTEQKITHESDDNDFDDVDTILNTLADIDTIEDRVVESEVEDFDLDDFSDEQNTSNSQQISTDISSSSLIENEVNESEMFSVIETEKVEQEQNEDEMFLEMETENNEQYGIADEMFPEIESEKTVQDSSTVVDDEMFLSTGDIKSFKEEELPNEEDNVMFDTKAQLNMDVIVKRETVEKKEISSFGKQVGDTVSNKSDTITDIANTFVNVINNEDSEKARAPAIDESNLTLRQYLKKHPYTSIEDILKLYPKKELDKALRLGKVITKNGTLRAL